MWDWCFAPFIDSRLFILECRWVRCSLETYRRNCLLTWFLDDDLTSIYLLESCFKIYELCHVHLFLHAKLLYNIHTPMWWHLALVYQYKRVYRKWIPGSPSSSYHLPRYTNKSALLLSGLICYWTLISPFCWVSVWLLYWHVSLGRNTLFLIICSHIMLSSVLQIFTTVWKIVSVDYVLKQILPNGVEVPSSFETIVKYLEVI